MRITKNMLEDYISSLGIKDLNLNLNPPKYSLSYSGEVFLEGTIREIYCFLQGMDTMSRISNGKRVDLFTQKEITAMDLITRLDTDIHIVVRKLFESSPFMYKNYLDMRIVSIDKDSKGRNVLILRVNSRVMLDDNTLVCRDMNLGKINIVFGKEKTRNDVIMLILKTINYYILRTLNQINDTTLISHMLWTSKSDLWSLNSKQISYLCDDIKIVDVQGIHLK